MDTHSANLRKSPVFFRSLAAFLLLSILSSCALPRMPWQPKPQPTVEVKQASPVPTEKPRPTLPPAVVETSPIAGSELSLDGKVVLTFSEAMDRHSVEAAVKVDPAIGGSFSWQDDATLVFTPDQPLRPDSLVTVSIDETARAANGLTMLAPREITFQAAGLLKITQRLPAPDSIEIDPTSAVVLAFNRPVVPLGANAEDIPAAFTLEPAVKGRSEWINTSTYIFYPDPSLGGGVTYTAQVNPELRGVNGEPLWDAARSDTPFGSWSFSTAPPAMSEVLPDQVNPLGISDPLTLVFNQPMDQASVEAAFSFTPAGGSPMAGEFTWAENGTRLTFKPGQQLLRSVSYTLSLAGSARSAGGGQIGEPFSTVYFSAAPLRVVDTNPMNGGTMEGWGGYGSLQIAFSAPIISSGIVDRIKITPAVTDLYAYADDDGRTLLLGGYYQPGQTYTVSVPADLLDLWGYRITEGYTFSFRVGPAIPSLTLGQGYYSPGEYVVTPDELTLPAEATNLSILTISRRDLTIQEFIRMAVVGAENLSGKRWTQPLDLSPDTRQGFELRLDPQGTALETGIYLLNVSAPELESPGTTSTLVVVSSLQVALKKGPEEALVWVMDGDTDQALAGIQVAIYDAEGNELASGQTDSQGLFHSDIVSQAESWKPIFALVSKPGEEDFGAASTEWNYGINGWDFGLPTNYEPSSLRTYLYTDRPIYRPGQTVNFRAVVRAADNGRYSQPDIFHLPVQITGYSPTTYEPIILDEQDLQLNDFGTASGSYTLPMDMQPGSYELRSTTVPETSLYFQVAEYRKPEIDVSVEFAQEEILDGDVLLADVHADYFFGAPAASVPFNWTLYDNTGWFALPGMAVGPVDTSWLEPSWMRFNPNFGSPIASGSGKTTAEGSFQLDLPSRGEDEPTAGATRRLMLEVTLADESGFTVSARDEVMVHPEEFYIGVEPDSWNGRAGEALGFLVQTVDWQQTPVSRAGLQARFQKVVWKEVVQPVSQNISPYPVFEPEYTLVGSTTFNTGSDGQARLSFTPAEPGAYQLDVSSGNALTQVILWVGGAESAIWPNLPDQHLKLTADKTSYLPGEKASIFVPNPFAASATALVTRERSRISDAKIVTVEAGGSMIELALGADDAPNIYVSVTLLGSESGRPSFRQGYVELAVSPLEQTLNVELVSQPQQTGPGEEVTFSLRVTDSNGKPVRGEFSLALVDLAALALAEPNSMGILDYFYGRQPLGVLTSLSLAAAPRRDMAEVPGVGGGGDGSLPSIRENFEDTAYWNPVIITGEDGLASVTARLPENLTTWKADLRGLTAGTQVGEAQLELVSTLPLLIRPETPRFVVLGDHLSLTAVVHNNTSAAMEASATLDAPGFALDDPQQATQAVDVSAGGRVLVTWWGKVGDVEVIDPTFRVNGGGKVDAARPELGALPVLKYVSPQTFSSAGVIAEPGDLFEVFAIPDSYTPVGGVLKVDLSPSLAAAILRNLEAAETPLYETNEAIVSAFLPNLQTYRLLTAAGLEKPELKPALDEAVRSGIDLLVAHQNPDGGWSWWSDDAPSDVYLTAYILFGLSQAKEAGFEVPAGVLDTAAQYLLDNAMPNAESKPWELDRVAFALYALTVHGGTVPDAINDLYSRRDRLNPWAQALLALSLEEASSGDDRVNTLMSDLQAKALRSATGAHWESENESWINPGTPVQTTAIVVYALSRLDPASDLLPESLRYLASHRGADLFWGSSYENAWVMLAFGEALKGTGELQASFNYSASLNDAPLVQGQAQGAQLLEGVQSTVPLQDLYLDGGNALKIQHGQGSGRLYYAAALQLNRPAEDAPPVTRGITVTRDYFRGDQDCRAVACEPVSSVSLGIGGQAAAMTVRLTVTLSTDMYHLMVEDIIPAGVEILDTQLKTSQAGLEAQPGDLPVVDASNPFGTGWGWWLFGSPRVFDDHISWAANFVPAGTYQLVYTFVPVFAGEYQVLPARAWEYFFPEVQGSSRGSKFEIMR